MINSRITHHASRITFPALAAVTLLGLAVRLFGLTDYGVWFDEAYHVQLVRLPTVGDMLDAVLSNPPSDPLYLLLLRPWVALFGHGDGAIRLLPVIFSTATLPATYWLGRTLFDYRAGLLAALFLALSPYAVELGQEGALYALASLTTTLALAAGWQWRASGTRRDGLLYVLLGIVAIYSHYVFAAILGLFAVLSLMRWVGPRRVSARAWLLAHAAIFVAWLPWFIALAMHWVNAELPRATRRDAATLSEVGGALTQFTSGTASLLQGIRPLEWAGLLLGVLLIGLGWVTGRPLERRGLRLVLAISALIFFVPALVSAATELWLFIPHFMIFLLPAILVTMASGLLHLWKPDGRFSAEPQSTQSFYKAKHHVSRFTFHAVTAAWVSVQLLGLIFYYRDPPHGRDGLRELAATLRSEMQAGDAVLVTPPILTPTLRQYYDGPLRGLPSDFDLRAVYLVYEPEEWHAGLMSGFDGVIPGHPRFWLVYRSEWDDGDRFLSSVKGRYKEVKHNSYEFAQLYLFEQK
jgi:hypothetical protein